MATFKNFKGRAGTGAVKIVGLDRATKRLRKLEKSSDDILSAEMVRAATRVVKRANRDVPVDTGALNRSIRVDKRGKRSVEINVTEKYAGFVEKGTSRMKAQPYLFKHIPPSLKLMIANLKRILTK